MAIRLARDVQTEEARAAGYLWTTEEDPTWLRYQVDFTNGAMRGFHISKCEGAIPKVTPFLYDFAHIATAAEFHETVAMAILADIGKENLIRAGEEYGGDKTANQVSSWQDFMSAFDDGPAKKATDDLISSRFITYPKDMPMPGGLVRIGDRGALSMTRGRNFKIGARMSGFEAYKIATTARMPKKLKIGDMGDPDIAQAQEALKHVQRPSSQAVNWYGTRNTKTANIRMQAAKSMPILAGLIADRMSLSRAVDEMQPIQPILIETTGLAKAGVKRIGKLTTAAPAGRIFEAGERIEGEDALGVNRARHTQISGSVPIDMALRYLSQLPPDRTPQDDESWLKFNDILTAMAIPLHNATGIPVAEILEASKGNWVKYHESLARGADFNPQDFDRRTMALTTIDAMEAIEHFSRTAVLPQALASIKETEQPEPMVSREYVISAFESATNLIIGKTKNVPLLMMEISRRYASRIPAMMEIEGKSMLAYTKNATEGFKKYGEDGFPLMTREFVASNGLVVRPLPTGASLSLESDRLKHCVGSYKSSARRAQCHIYSVQDQAGEHSFSTVEFAGIDGDDPMAAANALRTVQHRAECNATPSEDCKKAVKEFVAAVKSGAVPLNLEEISIWRAHLIETGQNARTHVTPTTTWKSVLELDWEDDDARLAYWQEWGEVLGGRIQKSPNPAVIYTDKGAQELVGAMSPRAAALMIEASRRERAEREAARAAEKAAELEEEPDMMG